MARKRRQSKAQQQLKGKALGEEPEPVVPAPKKGSYPRRSGRNVKKEIITEVSVDESLELSADEKVAEAEPDTSGPDLKRGRYGRRSGRNILKSQTVEDKEAEVSVKPVEEDISTDDEEEHWDISAATIKKREGQSEGLMDKLESFLDSIEVSPTVATPSTKDSSALAHHETPTKSFSTGLDVNIGVPSPRRKSSRLQEMHDKKDIKISKSTSGPPPTSGKQTRGGRGRKRKIAASSLSPPRVTLDLLKVENPEPTSDTSKSAEAGSEQCPPDSTTSSPPFSPPTVALKPPSPVTLVKIKQEKMDDEDDPDVVVNLNLVKRELADEDCSFNEGWNSNSQSEHFPAPIIESSMTFLSRPKRPDRKVPQPPVLKVGGEVRRGEVITVERTQEQPRLGSGILTGRIVPNTGKFLPPLAPPVQEGQLVPYRGPSTSSAMSSLQQIPSSSTAGAITTLTPVSTELVAQREQYYVVDPDKDREMFEKPQGYLLKSALMNYHSLATVELPKLTRTLNLKEAYINNLEVSLTAAQDIQAKLMKENAELREKNFNYMVISDRERYRAEEAWKRIDQTQLYSKAKEHGAEQRYFLKNKFENAVEQIKLNYDKKLKDLESDRSKLAKENELLNRKIKKNNKKSKKGGKTIDSLKKIIMTELKCLEISYPGVNVGDVLKNVMTDPELLELFEECLTCVEWVGEVEEMALDFNNALGGFERNMELHDDKEEDSDDQGSLDSVPSAPLDEIESSKTKTKTDETNSSDEDDEEEEDFEDVNFESTLPVFDKRDLEEEVNHGEQHLQPLDQPSVVFKSVCLPGEKITKGREEQEDVPKNLRFEPIEVEQEHVEFIEVDVKSFSTPVEDNVLVQVENCMNVAESLLETPIPISDNSSVGEHGVDELIKSIFQEQAPDVHDLVGETSKNFMQVEPPFTSATMAPVPDDNAQVEFHPIPSFPSSFISNKDYSGVAETQLEDAEILGVLDQCKDLAQYETHSEVQTLGSKNQHDENRDDGSKDVVTTDYNTSLQLPEASFKDGERSNINLTLDLDKALNQETTINPTTAEIQTKTREAVIEDIEVEPKTTPADQVKIVTENLEENRENVAATPSLPQDPDSDTEYVSHWDSDSSEDPIPPIILLENYSKRERKRQRRARGIERKKRRMDAAERVRQSVRSRLIRENEIVPIKAATCEKIKLDKHIKENLEKWRRDRTLKLMEKGLRGAKIASPPAHITPTPNLKEVSDKNKGPGRSRNDEDFKTQSLKRSSSDAKPPKKRSKYTMEELFGDEAAEKETQLVLPETLMRSLAKECSNSESSSSISSESENSCASPKKDPVKEMYKELDLELSTSESDTETGINYTLPLSGPASPEPEERFLACPGHVFHYTMDTDEATMVHLRKLMDLTVDDIYNNPFYMVKFPETTIQKLVSCIYLVITNTSHRQLSADVVKDERVSQCPLNPRFLVLLGIMVHLEKKYPELGLKFMEFIEQVFEDDLRREFEREDLLVNFGRFVGALSLKWELKNATLRTIFAFGLYRGPLIYSYVYGVLCSDSNVFGFYDFIGFEGMDVESRAIIFSLVRSVRWGDAKRSGPVIDLLVKSLQITVPEVAFDKFVENILDRLKELESQREIEKFCRVLCYLIVQKEWQWFRENVVGKLVSSWIEDWSKGLISDGIFCGLLEGVVGRACSCFRRKDLPTTEDLNTVLGVLNAVTSITGVKTNAVIMESIQRAIEQISSIIPRNNDLPLEEWHYQKRYLPKTRSGGGTGPDGTGAGQNRKRGRGGGRGRGGRGNSRGNRGGGSGGWIRGDADTGTPSGWRGRGKSSSVRGSTNRGRSPRGGGRGRGGYQNQMRGRN